MIAKPLGNFVEKILTPPPSFWQKAAAFGARNAGNIAKGVAAVGAVIPIFLEIRDARKAQEQERKLQAERENILTAFEDFADEIFNNINIGIKNWTTENIDKIIFECDDAIKNIHAEKNNSKIISDKLSALLKRTNNLIDEVQMNK